MQLVHISVRLHHSPKSTASNHITEFTPPTTWKYNLNIGLLLTFRYNEWIQCWCTSTLDFRLTDASEASFYDCHKNSSTGSIKMARRKAAYRSSNRPAQAVYGNFILSNISATVCSAYGRIPCASIPRNDGVEKGKKRQFIRSLESFAFQKHLKRLGTLNAVIVHTGPV